MKICVFGAGAIGGYLAVELALADHEVSVVARGEHLAAIRARGLKLRIGGQEKVAMDALMGIVGALVIAHWSLGLIRSSGAVLLDAVPDADLSDRIRARFEVDGDRLADLHLWRIGPGHTAVVASLVADSPQPPSVYKGRLKGLPGLSHITVEVNPCRNG